MYHWIYNRINVSVGLSDEDVRERFAEYADESIKGGREALTEEHYLGVLKEHREARELYSFVMGGCR